MNECEEGGCHLLDAVYDCDFFQGSGARVMETWETKATPHCRGNFRYDGE
jgi:hypothetical protein